MELRHSGGQHLVHPGQALDEGAVEGAASGPATLASTLTGRVAQVVHQTVVSAGHSTVLVAVLPGSTVRSGHNIPSHPVNHPVGQVSRSTGTKSECNQTMVILRAQLVRTRPG